MIFTQDVRLLSVEQDKIEMDKGKDIPFIQVQFMDEVSNETFKMNCYNKNEIKKIGALEKKKFQTIKIQIELVNKSTKFGMKVKPKLKAVNI